MREYLDYKFNLLDYVGKEQVVSIVRECRKNGSRVPGYLLLHHSTTCGVEKYSGMKGPQLLGIETV